MSCILQVFKYIFAWQGLKLATIPSNLKNFKQNAAKNPLIFQLLTTVASRLCVDADVDIPTATELCVNYFSNVAEKAPNAEVFLTCLEVIENISAVSGCKMLHVCVE